MSNNPATRPDNDPAIAAFARQHPAWTIWKAISGRYYARLTGSQTTVMAELLIELGEEITASEAQSGGPR
jgi:hypothetical protein